MKMKSVLTGMGIAVAVGSAVSVAASMAEPSTKRQYKKKASKALKSIEQMFSDAQYMFK